VAADLTMSLPESKEAIASGAGARNLMLQMMSVYDLNPVAVSARAPTFEALG